MRINIVNIVNADNINIVNADNIRIVLHKSKNLKND